MCCCNPLHCNTVLFKRSNVYKKQTENYTRNLQYVISVSNLNLSTYTKHCHSPAFHSSASLHRAPTKNASKINIKRLPFKPYEHLSSTTATPVRGTICTPLFLPSQHASLFNTNPQNPKKTPPYTSERVPSSYYLLFLQSNDLTQSSIGLFSLTCNRKGRE